MEINVYERKQAVEQLSSGFGSIETTIKDMVVQISARRAAVEDVALSFWLDSIREHLRKVEWYMGELKAAVDTAESRHFAMPAVLPPVG